MWTVWCSQPTKEANIPTSFYRSEGFPGSSKVKNLLAHTRDEALIPGLGREAPLEEGMATHSSIHAWEIPRTEEPGGLRFVSQRDATEQLKREF